LRLTPFAFEQGGQISPVWSPDGKGVAFAARQNLSDQYQVYVRYPGSQHAGAQLETLVDIRRESAELRDGEADLQYLAHGGIERDHAAVTHPVATHMGADGGVYVLDESTTGLHLVSPSLRARLTGLTCRNRS
jgi:WD40-like Beta Propeller Repeat